MRFRTAVSSVGVVLAAVTCLAQTAVPAAPKGVYDDFNTQWLSPTKWKVGVDYCWGNCLESVREIDHFKLRLAVRSVGRLGTNTGTAYSQAALPFPDPVSLALKSVQAEVLVKDYGGVPCEANTDDSTHAEVYLGGGFFNSGGNGDWLDDVRASIIAWVDTSNPTTLQIGLWWGLNRDWTVGGWTPIAAYPVGTPLTLRLTWDKLGHRFIGSVRSKDPADSGTQVSADYGSLPVAGPAINFEKALSAMTNAVGCSSVQSESHVDSRFDNVFVKLEP